MGMSPTASPDILAELAVRLDSMREPVCGFVFALVGDVALARNIAQEVCAQAACDVERGLLALQEDGSDDVMRRWLFCRAYRQALALRPLGDRDQPVPSAPDPRLDRAYEPARFQDQRAESRTLRAALGTLGPQATACLLLNVVEGFSVGQIAAMVELIPAVVKKHLIVAKQCLRDAYCAACASQQATHGRD